LEKKITAPERKHASVAVKIVLPVETMFAKDGIFLEKNEPQQQKPIEKKGTENLTETLIFQKPVQQEMPDFSKITTISSLVTFEKKCCSLLHQKTKQIEIKNDERSS